MNVVLATGIYPPEIGGPATFTRALAQALQAESIETTIVTYGDERTAREPAPVLVAARTSGVLGRYYTYAKHVYRAAKTCDAVFAQGPVSEGIPACLAAFCARKPFVLKVVGDVAWETAQRQGNAQPLDTFLQAPRASFKARLLIVLERLVARSAVRVITPSRYLQSVVRAWGVKEERSAVIYNAVHEQQEDMAAEALRAQYGLEGKRVLLAGGRLLPWKRIEILLEALARRPASEILVVAGDGPCLARWKQLAQELKLEERVIWLGLCSGKRMASWYGVADAFLLPSLYEGLPHMVLEAAIHGCPSLVSRWGGSREAADLCPGMVRVVESDEPGDWSAAFDGVSRTRNVASMTIARWTQAEQMRAYIDALRGMKK